MAGASAKILLFGEHIVLQGAEALAMPWTIFSGKWAWQKADQQQELPQWANYLQDLQHKDQLLAPLDILAFQKDLRKGLHFDSNIPTGYGVGSSGALCAALYKRYQTKTAPDNLVLLRQQLAQLESFFHGSSSGTDPLICYLEQAVHIVPEQDIRAFDWDWNSYSGPSFFVLDTGLKRNTAPWVAAFKAKAIQSAFKQQMNELLIPNSNTAIQALLEGDSNLLRHTFQQISHFHYKNLRNWIPEPFHPLWHAGLMRGTYHLKLCGAGGGGFILGLAQNPEVIIQLQRDYQLRPIN